MEAASSPMRSEGSSIKDVGNLEEGKGSNWIEILRPDRSKKSAHMGERGVKIREKTADVFNGRSLKEPAQISNRYYIIHVASAFIWWEIWLDCLWNSNFVFWQSLYCI